MGLSRAVSSDRTLHEVVSYAEWLGCNVLEYKGFSNVHANGSFHADGATDPRFRGYRQAADINHDGHGDRAEFEFLLDNLYHYAVVERGLAATFPALTNGYGVANHSIGDSLHLHLDRGEYTNRGHGAEHLKWTGHDRGPSESQVKHIQRLLGLKQDGIQGLHTFHAIARVQKELGLRVDALWGKRTASAYEKKYGNRPRAKGPLRKRRKRSPQMRKGTKRHKKVRQLQRGLNRHGARPRLAVDGDFGWRTVRALNIFKRKHHWNTDGVCGTRVAKALGFRL